MKIATCIRGLEDISAKELKGKKIAEGRILFSKNIKDPRTVNHIYELFDKFKFKTIKDITKKIKAFKLKKNIKIECNREGKHNFKSVDIEKEASKILIEKGFKPDYKKYKEIFYIDIINNLCFLGKIIKKDLCKRNYRVKLKSNTIPACLASSTLKLLDLKSKETFLDPLCGDGIIAIEASYLTKKVYAYDKDTFSAKINAKIGKRKINFENLQFNEIKITADKILTYLPSQSKKRKNPEILYKKFFKYIKPKNKLGIICYKSDLIKKYIKPLKLVEERKVKIGENILKILILKK